MDQSTVALYCRISVDRQGRKEGVDAQERWGREYAAEHWPGRPVRVFSDNNVSAARDDIRPEYDQLRAAIRAGEITHLWAVEQSRLERRELHWFELAAELDAAGIKTVDTLRDGVLQVHDDVAGIRAVLNAGEVRKLKRRVNDKLDELAAQGRPAGGAFFGYRRTVTAAGVKTLEIVPEEAEAIRWAAQAVLSGWSLTNISAELRRRGHRGVLGGHLGTSTVRTMLSSPAIAGQRQHRGVIVGRGNWEPIISEDVSQAVRSRLSQPRTVICADGRAHPVTDASLMSKTTRKYILTGGLSRCGVCGSALVGCIKHFKKKVRRPYLMCSATQGGRSCVGIMMEAAEQHVTDQLFDALDKPEFLAAVSDDDHASRREALTAALAGVDQQRSELAGLWAAGDMSTVEWQTARAGLDQREQSLRTELATIPPPVGRIDITGVRSAWPAMTVDERRELLRLFISRITIQPVGRGNGFSPDRIEITWRTL